MTPTLTRVKSLVITRVDLVDVGASLDKRTGEGAHVLLFKRAAGAGPGLSARPPAGPPAHHHVLSTLRGEAWAVLERHAGTLRATDPTLSREAALAKTVRELPAVAEVYALGVRRGEPLDRPAPPPARTPRNVLVQKAALTFDQALMATQADEVWRDVDQLVQTLAGVCYGVLYDSETADKRGAIRSALEAFGLQLDQVLEAWLGAVAPGDVTKRAAVRSRIHADVQRAAEGLLRQRARLAVERAGGRGPALQSTAYTVYRECVRRGVPEPPVARG